MKYRKPQRFDFKGTNEQVLEKLINHKRVYMDITFSSYPTPIPAIEVEIRKRLNENLTIRHATIEDIERIVEFFDVSKLISECKARF